MGGESSAQREKESNENHRQRHHGEDDMGDKQRKVDEANSSFALKVHLAVQGIVGDIGHDKKRRENERREHRRAVGVDVLRANEQKADE